jgi:hypothetical protein
MGNRKKRQPGPQKHAEGAHGEKTHRRLIEQLQSGERQPKRTEGAWIEGRHRLHEDRQQHDEAEKNGEKNRAVKEIVRGDRDEMLIAQARIPPESLK